MTTMKLKGSWKFNGAVFHLFEDYHAWSACLKEHRMYTTSEAVKSPPVERRCRECRKASLRSQERTGAKA